MNAFITGLTDYGYTSYALVTRDEQNRDTPISFCIFSDDTSEVVNTFFEALKLSAEQKWIHISSQVNKWISFPKIISKISERQKVHESRQTLKLPKSSSRIVSKDKLTASNGVCVCESVTHVSNANNAPSTFTNSTAHITVTKSHAQSISLSESSPAYEPISTNETPPSEECTCDSAAHSCRAFTLPSPYSSFPSFFYPLYGHNKNAYPVFRDFGMNPNMSPAQQNNQCMSSEPPPSIPDNFTTLLKLKKKPRTEENDINNHFSNIEDRSNDCQVVDWNGDVFVSLKKSGNYIFCKRQIGQMTGHQFISNENKDSFVLNRKDIQGDQRGYIISCVKCYVNDNRICLFKPSSTFKDSILDYMKDGGSTKNDNNDDEADDTSNKINC
ncbi:unnamed protein product [Mytilus coruscus]|uniref:Uncharacterized protein n=1 Tax=Mytilus coruscus TaxID=42192 RepID=A0A6J8DR57_MYTCO|nr:unnamed protein product [Mytilus coruscus]